jgi:hypothetical protein
MENEDERELYTDGKSKTDSQGNVSNTLRTVRFRARKYFAKFTSLFAVHNQSVLSLTFRNVRVFSHVATYSVPHSSCVTASYVNAVCIMYFQHRLEAPSAVCTEVVQTR